MKPYKQQQKRKSAFFEHFLRQSGPDFLLKENAISLKRKAMMFFRDVAYASFEMDKHGQYLSDDRLLELMTNEARGKMMYYIIHCNAISYMVGGDPSTNTLDVQDTYRKDYDSASAYTILYNGLCNIMYTKNLSMFDVIANQMKAVKYNL